MRGAMRVMAAMTIIAGLAAPAGGTFAPERYAAQPHASLQRFDTPTLERRVLEAHNRARSAYGIAPLRWDPELARSAAAWGRELVRRNAFEHSRGRGDMGENLWEGTPGAFSPEEMVGRWVGEKRIFKAGVFPNNSTTGNWTAVGHYTQLMWRNSTALGCALVPGPRADVLVCRYAPAGNVYGEVPF